MLTKVKCDFLQGCLMAGCLNGGSCLFDKEKEAFACSCNLQWSGEKCELGKFLVFFVPEYIYDSERGVMFEAIDCIWQIFQWYKES